MTVSGTGEIGASALRRFARSVRCRVAGRPAEFICAGLLAMMAVNLFVVVWRKTITNDEIVHIPAGYHHLVAGNFELNNEHPPLAKMWAAIPLVFVKPVRPPAPSNAEENFAEAMWGFHARFWPTNAERFETIIFWPRLWMILLALALGAVIFVYARRLFGPRAAVLAVALYSIEPTMLAHGRTVHTDVPASLVYLVFFFALHHYLETPNRRRAAWLALATGVALLTKFSMIVLLPILAVVVMIAFWKAPAWDIPRKEIALHAGIGFLIILFLLNAGYAFQHPPVSEADVRWVQMRTPDIAPQLMQLFRIGSWVVPTYFMFGLYNVMIHNHFGHAASLLGMQSDLGWWYYFPVAFALKTTLAFLILSLATVAWAAHQAIIRHDRRFWLLLVGLLVYTGICLSSHINIGVRHFLPAFPFIFILAGALLDHVLEHSGRWRRVAYATVMLAFGWMAFETVRAFPHYMSYMNQLAWQRPHYWYLSDSNVEWGDDINGLAKYLRERGETRVQGAFSGGWTTLRFYGVEHINMVVAPGTPLPETRYVALGASFLNGSTVPGLETKSAPGQERTDFFARYRDRKPEAIFGNSIYLYRER